VNQWFNGIHSEEVFHADLMRPGVAYRPIADIHGFQNSGKKKPAKADSSCSFAESDYTVLRFIQPSNPSAEPSSKTAGGTGIAGTTAE
jgi:hypothetical protein